MMSSTLYKKVIGKLANAGTVALLGYEAGTHFGGEKEEHTPENNSDIIIIVGIILLIGILGAISARLLYMKRRPLV